MSYTHLKFETNWNHEILLVCTHPDCRVPGEEADHQVQYSLTLGKVTTLTDSTTLADSHMSDKHSNHDPY